MSTIELQRNIYNCVSGISDKVILNEINSVLMNEQSKEIFHCSDIQRRLIENAMKEVDNGNFYSDFEIEIFAEQCLQEN